MEILKSKEDHWDLFKDLLKEICKGFPAEDPSQDQGSGSGFVRVSCPWDESNAVTVSLEGFLLLEAAEGAMSSTEQNLELLMVDFLRPILLSSLGSRLARQQGKDVESRVVVSQAILCLSVESANDLSSVMQHCSALDLRGNLVVGTDIRREGWTALREALSWRLHDIPHIDTDCKCKGYVASARREDLRAIWECISVSWMFRSEISRPDGGVTVFDFEKQMGDEGLAALERFVDLTEEEWIARRRARLAIRREHMSINGQPLQAWTGNVALELIVLKVGEMEVEVQMQEPGRRGLNRALQQVTLFHPAFGPQPQLDQEEEGQVEDGAGQVGQVPNEVGDQVGDGADEVGLLVEDEAGNEQGHEED